MAEKTNVWSEGWFDWQTQQADRREKVTEEQQHKLGDGLGDAESRDVAMPVLLLAGSKSGHRKSRLRKGSEAEGEQTWRTRWTTWPGNAAHTVT